jgi:hypothetical protein
MTHFRLAVLALLLLAPVCPGQAPADDPDYEIRLHRPSKPGDKFNIAFSAAFRQEASYSQNGNPSGGNEYLIGVEMQGVAEVLEVDERGADKKVKYVIDRLVRVVDNVEKPILKKGDVLYAVAGEKDSVFTVEGEKKLSNEELAAVELVASVPDTGEPTTDELYGSAQRRKITSTWPVNAKALTQRSRRHGMTFSENDVKGSMTFKGVESENNMRWMDLSSEVKIDNLINEPPKGWTLPDMKVTSASSEQKLSLLLPVDVKLLHVTGSFSHMRTIKMVDTSRRRLDMDLKFTHLVEMRVTHIEK